jgi:hypothetical protein
MKHLNKFLLAVMMMGIVHTAQDSNNQWAALLELMHRH